ncbi:hypothetical protein T484DRAFT_2567627 [Baffinella frigidus]|nr:hypothetical protein T484DRAFT_2567627 [Cryptophyta sp. CCMP2293]
MTSLGATPQSHLSHTSVTPPSHLSHTSVTPQSHLKSHLSHTSVTPQSHLSHTSVTPQSHFSHTSVTPQSHLSPYSDIASFAHGVMRCWCSKSVSLERKNSVSQLTVFAVTCSRVYSGSQ